MKRKPGFRVGQIVMMRINSEHNGKPILFECEGKIVRVNGTLFVRLKNGMQAPVESLKLERGPERKS